MIDKRMKVRDNVNLRRDPYSKGIINTDVAGLREHKQKIKMVETVEQNAQKISRLENDISDIKSMLTYLINKK